MIEIRHLRYFVAVAEELHFGRAAERLHMAQSPLSHQIRQLERQLGVVLLDRDHHVVGMTDAGRVFLDEARSVLGALDQAVERARRAGLGEVGRVSVGYVADMTAQILPRSLRAHRERFPDVAIDLCQGITGALLSSIRDRTLDVAFVRSPGPMDDLEYEQLLDEELYVALPSGHRAAPPPLRLGDLGAETLIVPGYEAARGLRQDIESACTLAGLVPQARREASSLTAVLLLVAAGAGVALVPASLTSSYPIPGVTYLPATDAPNTSGGLSWRRDDPSEIVTNFLDTARRVVGRIDAPPGPAAMGGSGALDAEGGGSSHQTCAAGAADADGFGRQQTTRHGERRRG